MCGSGIYLRNEFLSNIYYYRLNRTLYCAILVAWRDGACPQRLRLASRAGKWQTPV